MRDPRTSSLPTKRVYATLPAQAPRHGLPLLTNATTTCGVAFAAAVDDHKRFRRSRDLGAYLGLVPRRYQSGEVDYTGSISKCGDRRVRTLRYEAANVILMRYKGALKLKEGALAIARRSTLRKALAPAARHHHARHAPTRHRVQTGLALNCTRDRRPKKKLPNGSDARGRERMTAPIL